MARVETEEINLSDEEQRKMIRREVKKEMNKSGRRAAIRNCLGCFTINVIIFLVVAGLVLFAVAKTGLVRLPLFSRAYVKPMPTYNVLPGGKTLDEILAQQLKKQAALGQQSQNGVKEISFVVNEKELTKALREIISAQKTNIISAERTQVAVLADSVEIFIGFAGNTDSAAQINVAPEINNGKLAFKITRAKIGSLMIWRGLANILFSGLSEAALDGLNKTDGLDFKISGVKLEPGSIKAVIEIDASKLNIK